MNSKLFFEILANNNDKKFKDAYKKVKNKHFLEGIMEMKYLCSNWLLVSHEAQSSVFEFRDMNGDFKCVVDVDNESIRILPMYVTLYEEEENFEMEKRKSIIGSILDSIMEWFNVLLIIAVIVLIVLLAEGYIAHILR